MNVKEILQDLKNDPARELFRLVRIPLLFVLVIWVYRNVLIGIPDFEGWLATLKLDLFKALAGLVIFYLADRILCHGDRAHDLEGAELQIRNAVRLGGAAVVIGLSLSGG